MDDPVIHVETAEGEHVYSIRAHGAKFSPKVFSLGEFKVTVEHPESGKKAVLKLDSQAEAGGEMKVVLE